MARSQRKAIPRYDPGYEGWMPAARRIIDPYIMILGGVVFAAWREYRFKHGGYVVDYNTTAKTILLHRYMLKGAAKLPLMYPGQIRVFEPVNAYYLIIGDEVIVRFKKMELPKLETTNYPTRLQQELTAGNLDLFSEKRLEYLINVGYVFDPFELSYSHLIVSQWTGGPQAEWMAEIKFDENEIATVIDTFGTPDLFRDSWSPEPPPPSNLRAKDDHSRPDQTTEDKPDDAEDQPRDDGTSQPSHD